MGSALTASSIGFTQGGGHEILNEGEKDRVHRDIGHWLTQILDE